jgi:hypothetical protein
MVRALAPLVPVVLVPGVVRVAELDVSVAPAPYPLPLLGRSNCQGTATSLPMLDVTAEDRLEISEPGCAVEEERWGSVAEREVSVDVDVSRSVVLVPGLVVLAPGVVDVAPVAPAPDAPLDSESNAS